MTGWINYYGIGEMKTFMSELNGWLKRRIRQYIWKQWKNPRTKRKNLIRLGIDKAKRMNGQIQEKVFGQSPKVIFFIDH